EMARVPGASCCGGLVGLGLGAALGIRAEPDEVLAAANEAGVDPIDLLGAVNSTGLEARTYLRAVGELRAEPDSRPPAAPSNPRVECVIWHESRGVPAALHPRSGHAGLGPLVA